MADSFNIALNELVFTIADDVGQPFSQILIVLNDYL